MNIKSWPTIQLQNARTHNYYRIFEFLNHERTFNTHTLFSNELWWFVHFKANSKNLVLCLNCSHWTFFCSYVVVFFGLLCDVEIKFNTMVHSKGIWPRLLGDCTHGVFAVIFYFSVRLPSFLSGAHTHHNFFVHFVSSPWIQCSHRFNELVSMFFFFLISSFLCL